jgi:hypothetical protein
MPLHRAALSLGHTSLPDLPVLQPYHPEVISWRLERLANLVTYQRCMRALHTASQQLLGPSGPEAQPVLQLLVSSWPGCAGGNPGGAGMAGARSVVAAALDSHVASSLGQDSVKAALPQELICACTAPLNKSQAAAVCAAVTQRLTLIWGPPGTGKVSHSLISDLPQRKVLRNEPCSLRVSCRMLRAPWPASLFCRGWVCLGYMGYHLCMAVHALGVEATCWLYMHLVSKPHAGARYARITLQ